MNKTKVFVSGTGRAGTSALVDLLNRSEDFMIGQERFYFVLNQNKLTKEHFEKQRFLDVRESDTHNQPGFKSGIGSDLEARFERAKIYGEKFPSLFKVFDTIFDELPDAKHIYIVRNPLSVVESYDVRHKNPNDSWKHTFEDGMKAWNESVSKVANLSDAQLENFVIVSYESFYSSPRTIKKLFEILETEAPSDESINSFVDKFNELNQRPSPRRDDIRQFVALNADWESYKHVIKNALEV